MPDSHVNPTIDCDNKDCVNGRVIVDENEREKVEILRYVLEMMVLKPKYFMNDSGKLLLKNIEEVIYLNTEICPECVGYQIISDDQLAEMARLSGADEKHDNKI